MRLDPASFELVSIDGEIALVLRLGRQPIDSIPQLERSPRAYDVLDEIGTRPSLTYLKKVVREHA